MSDDAKPSRVPVGTDLSDHHLSDRQAEAGERLKEIQARCDAATPGPWTVAYNQFIAHIREDVPYLLHLCLDLQDRVESLVTECTMSAMQGAKAEEKWQYKVRDLETTLKEQTRRAIEAQNEVHELKAELHRLRDQTQQMKTLLEERLVRAVTAEERAVELEQGHAEITGLKYSLMYERDEHEQARAEITRLKSDLEDAIEIAAGCENRALTDADRVELKKLRALI